MSYYQEINSFLQEHGLDAFKIIAAYEDAVDISYKERYATWFGDYGIFEPSVNAEITYDKLLARYNAGLNCLGIDKEQAAMVCDRFSSEQLTSRIRAELKTQNKEM